MQCFLLRRETLDIQVPAKRKAVLPDSVPRLSQYPALDYEMVSRFVSFVSQKALKLTQTHLSIPPHPQVVNIKPEE